MTSGEKPQPDQERQPLYAELALTLRGVLAMRYLESSAEDKQAVKQIMGHDTGELLLPKIASDAARSRENGELPPRIRERQDRDRQERNVRDAFQRYGHRDRKR